MNSALNLKMHKRCGENRLCSASLFSPLNSHENALKTDTHSPVKDTYNFQSIMRAITNTESVIIYAKYMHIYVYESRTGTIKLTNEH